MSFKTHTRDCCQKITQRIEIVYVSLLPFIGAWAAMELESRYVTWIIVGGWLLATINVYIYVPAILAGYGRNWVLIVVPFLRIALLAFKQGISDGSVWAFFLDAALIETGNLMLGFSFYFAFGTGVSGNNAWKDLGIFVPVMMILLFLASVGGFILASLENQPAGRLDALLLLIAALGISVHEKVKLIGAIKGDAIDPDAMYSDNFLILLAVPFAYILLLPGLFALKEWIFT